jgi:hypothetical protein
VVLLHATKGNELLAPLPPSLTRLAELRAAPKARRIALVRRMYSGGALGEVIDLSAQTFDPIAQEAAVLYAPPMSSTDDRPATASSVPHVPPTVKTEPVPQSASRQARARGRARDRRSEGGARPQAHDVGPRAHDRPHARLNQLQGKTIRASEFKSWTSAVDSPSSAGMKPPLPGPQPPPRVQTVKSRFFLTRATRRRPRAREVSCDHPAHDAAEPQPPS